jgi:hypothetical protein
MTAFDGLSDLPKKMKLTFRIQKNRQNGQSITFVADNKHPQICPVRAAHRIYLRAKRLGKSDDQPMGIFINHQGIVKYLTANKITEVLQSVAKTCHPNISRDEIMRFSSHSIRVWAVVDHSSFFACLQYIAAPSYLRQSALSLRSSVCGLQPQRGVHATMEVWPTARTFRSRKLAFSDPA